MRQSIIAALAIGALATPALAQRPTSPKCAPVTEAALDQQFAKFNAAWATKNPDTVTNLFARDAVLLPTVSNVPRTDHAQIRDYFVSFLRGEPVGTINTSTIKLGCNVAYRMGTWTVGLTNQNSGVRNDVKARYSFIYAWSDGEWKIAHLHSSMMPVSE